MFQIPPQLTTKLWHERSLVRRYLRCWKSSIETHKRLTQEAEHALYYFLARRSLMKWHKRFRQVRKKKRQKTLDDHLHGKNMRLLMRCFSHWRQETTDCLHLQRIADEVRGERDLDLLSDTFMHWTERLHELRTLEAEAEDYNRFQVIRYVQLEDLLILYSNCYRKWKMAFGRIMDLSDHFNDHLLVRNQILAMQLLRAWRMRLFQLRGPTMQADLFKQRSERLKLRLILRIWREKTSAKKGLDEENTISTLEDSDKAHTAPVTPKRSTRRLLWRTLNSR